MAQEEGFDSRANCALGLPRSRTSTGSPLCTDSPSNPFMQKRNLSQTARVQLRLLMAQEEGFEPPWLLAKRFSRPPRCDRFDIPAYIWCGSLHIYTQSYFEVARETRFTNPLRIPHPKIEELALQAQGVGIFVKDEYPSSQPSSF